MGRSSLMRMMGTEFASDLKRIATFYVKCHTRMSKHALSTVPANGKAYNFIKYRTIVPAQWRACALGAALAVLILSAGSH